MQSCIENVASQATPEIEHIVMDGGSTDRSVAILEAAKGRYGHLRFVSEPDSGQSNAMNKGITMAAGRFIGILNVDDSYASDSLPRLLEIIKKGRFDSPAFLLGRCRWINQDGSLRDISRHDDYSLFGCLEGRFPPNPVCYFYEKSLHERVGLYDEANQNTMDYDFLLKAVRSINLYCFDEIWGTFFMHEDSKTALGEVNKTIDDAKGRVRAQYLETLSLTEQAGYSLYRAWHSHTAGAVRAHVRYPRMLLGKGRNLFRKNRSS